jgi:hypothetical protein
LLESTCLIYIKTSSCLVERTCLIYIKTSSCLLESTCLIYIKTSSCLLERTCLIYIKTSSCLLESPCLIYVICVWLRTEVSNTYCFVFLCCFSLSWLPHVASFSGLSILDFPLGIFFSNGYL